MFHAPGRLWPCVVLSLTLVCAPACTPDAFEAPQITPQPDQGQPDLGGEDMTTGPDLSEACPEPLAAVTTQGWAIPHQLVALEVRGGTGRYRFTLKTNSSSAILNELTGAYLAGPTFGVEDAVEVFDEGCDASITIPVKVVKPLTVSPMRAAVRPAQAFTFAATDGSGQARFALKEGPSGATLDAQGLYTAGASEGIDRVLVTDALTGEEVEAEITVSADTVFAADPPALVLAVGQRFKLPMRGGSGAVTITADNDHVTAQGGWITGVSPGTSALDVRDDFTGDSTTVSARVIAPQTFEGRPTGDYNSTDRLAVADVNGDGFPDAVLGHPESSQTAYRSGAVFIYRGTATGLEPTPARVIPGLARQEELGHDLLVRDVTGDGLPDLLVSARLADVGAADAGAVFVYKGAAGAMFEDEPAYIWSGANAGDQFGYSLESCDVNGDGAIDVIVGAPFAEDRDAQPQRSNQGGLHIFLGHESGFLMRPDVNVWGGLLGDAGWEPTANVELGWALASGDVDGDGLCDVATGNPSWATSDGGSSSGFAYIFRGRAPDSFGQGGLHASPAWALVHDRADQANAQFGRRLVMGDFNKDGRADLAVGAYAYRVNGGNSGAALVYYGGALPEIATALQDPDSADWMVVGNGGGDLMGWQLERGDLNGDGVDDLLVTACDDEISGSPGNAGVLHGFLGSDAGLEAEASVQISGAASGDRFGQAAAVAGDMNGDGLVDVVAFAPRAEGEGEGDDTAIDLGAMYVASGAEGHPLTRLELPQEASNMRFGNGAAFGPDLNGDGDPELIVGAPYVTSPGNTSGQHGAVYVYMSQGGAYPTAPSVTLQGFYTNSATDRFGWAVASAGDFDGDGAPDLAIAALTEDRPTRYNGSGYAQLGGEPCASVTTSRGDSGAVYIFRGTADGSVEPEPSFVFHGPHTSRTIRAVSAGGDINGDGYADVLVGSYRWLRDGNNEAGGFAVLWGRPYQGVDKLQVICALADRLDTDDANTSPDEDVLEDYIFLSDRNSAQLGWSLTALGDLNEDGCDDFAVGARNHSDGASAQGQIRVIYGWGSACQWAQPRGVALAPGSANARAGTSVASGGDLDGDGVPDLVVGGDAYRVGANAAGAAWVISGAYIKNLAPERLSTETRTITLEGGASRELDTRQLTSPTLHPFVPSGQPPVLVTGRQANELFGTAVAVVPGVGPDGAAGLLVGAPLSDRSGTSRSGGADLFVMRDGAIDPWPIATLAGESEAVEGRLGEVLDSATINGKPVAVMGGTFASLLGVDRGAALVCPLP